MSKGRTTIIEKIKALRARAKDEASSQSEVEAAAARAAKLISEHEVSEAELVESGVSGIAEGTHNQGRSRRHDAVRYAMSGINKATQTGGFFRGGEEIYVGDAADVEFAIYLCELIQSSADRAFKRYAAETGITGYCRNLERTTFLAFFGQAVGDRLYEIGLEREAALKAKHTTGSSLVVVKSELIDRYVDEKWGDVKKARRTKRKLYGREAQIAGATAGSNLNIERPLNAENQHAITT